LITLQGVELIAAVIFRVVVCSGSKTTTALWLTEQTASIAAIPGSLRIASSTLSASDLLVSPSMAKVFCSPVILKPQPLMTDRSVPLVTFSGA